MFSMILGRDMSFSLSCRVKERFSRTKWFLQSLSYRDVFASEVCEVSEDIQFIIAVGQPCVGRALPWLHMSHQWLVTYKIYRVSSFEMCSYFFGAREVPGIPGYQLKFDYFWFESDVLRCYLSHGLRSDEMAQLDESKYTSLNICITAISLHWFGRRYDF